MSEFREVPGFPGYTVSNVGEVIGRYCRRLNPAVTRDGYHRVTFRDGDRQVKLLVHRIVLMTFVGPAPEGSSACHNNGIRTDNRVENLRWDTTKNNCADIGKHGKRPPGAPRPRRLSNDLVSEMRRKNRAGQSVLSIADEYGIGTYTAHAAIRGITWRDAEEPPVPLQGQRRVPYQSRGIVGREDRGSSVAER